jgi:uncharacterized protein
MPINPKSDFKPAWWLANPHAQTVWPAFFRRQRKLLVKRERITTPDDDFLDLDWYGPDSGPLVILLHGLTGSSQSSYIIGMQCALLANGLRSVALNFRGCSGEMNLSSRCYHSGETTDLNFIYQLLRQREPKTPIAMVGYSLGGNALLKWLGEQRGQAQLFAAVAVSVPLLLDVCADRMDKGFSTLYRNRLIGELKDYIQQKRQHLRRNRRHQEAEIVDALGDLTPIRSFWQYDNQVVAQLYGFKDVHDYYRQSSSRQFIKHITVSTLIIHAADDPFMTAKVIPDETELSESVLLEITPKGGHVGFIAGNIPGKPYYWLEKRVPSFLNHHL